MTSMDYLSVGIKPMSAFCTQENIQTKDGNEVDYSRQIINDSIKAIVANEEVYLHSPRQIDLVLAFFEKTLQDSDFIRIQKYSCGHGLKSIKKFTAKEKGMVLSNIDRTDIYDY